MTRWTLLSFLVATTLPLQAQEVSAELTGRVTDPTGSAIAKANVTARDLDRGTTWPTTTNDDGIYTFPRIPNGKYTLKVEAQGFKTFSHPGIELEINQHGRVDVILQLGSVSETVEVTDEVATSCKPKPARSG